MKPVSRYARWAFYLKIRPKAPGPFLRQGELKPGRQKVKSTV
jgi:hypothetical protein